MRIIVAGAGVVGFPITRMLVENRHDVVVVDIDRDVCETVYAEIGAMAIHGSATAISILEKAGARKADVMLCLIRNEGDNITSVLLAKSLGVPYIVALMRKPRYEEAYKLAGATAIVSMTDLLLNQIMIEIEQPQVKGLMSLGGGKAEVFAIEIPRGAKSVGLTVQEIARQKNFPRECVFMGIYKEDEGDFLIPRGEHIFREGETVCLISSSQHIKQVTNFLIKT
jgi:trk system potassium uptake protein TrkA